MVYKSLLSLSLHYLDNKKSVKRVGYDMTMKIDSVWPNYVYQSFYLLFLCMLTYHHRILTGWLVVAGLLVLPLSLRQAWPLPLQPSLSHNGIFFALHVMSSFLPADTDAVPQRQHITRAYPVHLDLQLCGQFSITEYTPFNFLHFFMSQICVVQPLCHNPTLICKVVPRYLICEHSVSSAFSSIISMSSLCCRLLKLVVSILYFMYFSPTLSIPKYVCLIDIICADSSRLCY